MKIINILICIVISNIICKKEKLVNEVSINIRLMYVFMFPLHV